MNVTTVAASEALNKERKVPGEIGIWVLIFGDLMAFTALFLVFMYYKGADPQVFAESHGRMNQAFGAINTFLLLTSSWCVATGVNAARRNLGRLALNSFMAAFACGAAFAVVKYFEYGEKIAASLTINTNTFFNCYYMFTIIHLVHVSLGMVVLYLMSRKTRGHIDAPKISFMETGASFWHMVDLLWIVLFALFYLVK